MGDATLIDGYRRHFETVQRRARELMARGIAADEAVAAIATELEAPYAARQPGRIAGAARAAYREAEPSRYRTSLDAA
jgi:hypothetical protein